MAAEGDVEFGKRLRALTESIAKDAATSAALTEVDARLAKLGQEVYRWAERAAEGKVGAEAAGIVRQIVGDVAVTKRMLEDVDARLVRQAEILRGFDTERQNAIAAEIAADMGRILKQRGEFAAKLVETETALDGARKAALDVAGMVAKVDDAERRITAVADVLVGQLREHAEGAASDRVDALRGEVLALIDQFGQSMIAVAKAEIAVERARADNAIAAFEHESKAVLDEVLAKLGKGVGLAPIAFRGPWKHGTEYRRGDLVMDKGSTWIAKGPTRKRPESDDSWSLFASAGYQRGS